MPYPFELPIPLLPSLPSVFTCPEYPLLPSTFSAQRAVLRDVLYRYRKISRNAQLSNFADIETAISDYLPYLFTIDASLRDSATVLVEISVPSGIEYIWRAPLSVPPKAPFFLSNRGGKPPTLIHKRRAPYLCLRSFNAEVAFTLSALAASKYLHARSHLQLLHSAWEREDQQRRNATIGTVVKLYLEAYSIHEYIATRSLRWSSDVVQGSIVYHQKGIRNGTSTLRTSGPRAAAADISHPVQKALAELNVAEATLAVFLKDDPYPDIVANDRDESVRDWMFRAPEIPKLRVTLFSRMCVAASAHAAKACSLLRSVDSSSASSSPGSSETRAGGMASGMAQSSDSDPVPIQVTSQLVQYTENLRRVTRAKACRLQGVDAEGQGQYGVAIGWLRAAVQELFGPDEVTSPGSSTSTTQTLIDRIISSASYSFLLAVVVEGSEGIEGKPFTSLMSSSRRLVSKIKGRGSGGHQMSDSKAEEKRLLQGSSDWGTDAGMYEEARIIEMLFYKWNKTNEAFVYPIASISNLLPTLPSGRECHANIQTFTPPVLENSALQALRVASPLYQDRAFDDNVDGGCHHASSRHCNTHTHRHYKQPGRWSLESLPALPSQTLPSRVAPGTANDTHYFQSCNDYPSRRPGETKVEHGYSYEYNDYDDDEVEAIEFSGDEEDVCGPSSFGELLNRKHTGRYHADSGTSDRPGADPFEDSLIHHQGEYEGGNDHLDAIATGRGTTRTRGLYNSEVKHRGSASQFPVV